jgi:NDP-sugar pyrophosphorylase family protein
MSTTAFILAAGFGTRLRPLTLSRPKPLVPICGVPALSYSLATCARHGFRDVIINAHYLAPALEAWAGEREGCSVTVHVERPEILGTGGGLRAVRGQLAPRFVVLNADVLHTVDLRALIDAVPPGGGAMALRPDAERAPDYGVVAADAEGVVVRLAQVATADAHGPVDATTHFTGIHALDRDALDEIPDGFACVVRTAYRALVPRRAVRGLRYEGPWLDAGDPDAYLDANLDVLCDRVQLDLDPRSRAAWSVDIHGAAHGAVPRGVRVEGPCWVGPGAVIEPGARLSGAIIGANAHVPAGAALTDSVVWDHTRCAHGAWRRAVVHDAGLWEGA